MQICRLWSISTTCIWDFPFAINPIFLKHKITFASDFSDSYCMFLSYLDFDLDLGPTLVISEQQLSSADMVLLCNPIHNWVTTTAPGRFS